LPEEPKTEDPYVPKTEEVKIAVGDETSTYTDPQPEEPKTEDTTATTAPSTEEEYPEKMKIA
jgi:hypothetical protein